MGTLFRLFGSPAALCAAVFGQFARFFCAYFARRRGDPMWSPEPMGKIFISRPSVGSSFFPPNLCFDGNPITFSAAIRKRVFHSTKLRIGTSVTLAGLFARFFTLYNYIPSCLHQRAEYPQGRTKPPFVIGRPTSSVSEIPPNFFISVKR